MTLMNALWLFPFLQDFLIWQLQWWDEKAICKSDVEVFDHQRQESLKFLLTVLGTLRKLAVAM